MPKVDWGEACVNIESAAKSRSTLIESFDNGPADRFTRRGELGV
jgi:hypothetical protein